MNIAEWQEKVYALAKGKGWWDDVAPHNEDIIPEKIALIHSEASEALEVYRETPGDVALWPAYADKDGERHTDQYPVTSTFGIGEHPAHDRPRKPIGLDLDIDLERAIREKHAYNETRPRRHGGKRC